MEHRLAYAAHSSVIEPAPWRNARYLPGNMLGTGWGGTAYYAYDRLSGRSVAIKRINQPHTLPAEAVQLAELGAHPGLPQLYEVFYEAPHWFIVRELIAGLPLDVACQDRLPLSVMEVCAIGLQLCAILEHFQHASPPFIHCDLKPANILYMSDGLIKVIDFGRTVRLLPGIENSYVGPAGYAPPELGKRDQPLTVSVDIYEIGNVLRELLTGIVIEGSIKYDVLQLCTRMTGKNPVFRPKVADVAQALREYDRQARAMH